MALNAYRAKKTKAKYEKYRKLRNKCANLSKSALKDYFTKNCSDKYCPDIFLNSKYLKKNIIYING